MAQESFFWRIERIVSTVSIYEFFKWIGQSVEPNTRAHQIHCPFPMAHTHGDEHPSARVFPDSNKIRCFTEARSWDIIDAVMEYYGYSMLRAVSFIERKMGWSSSREDKLQSQLKRAKKKPGLSRAKVSHSEQSMLEAVEGLRKKLSPKIFHQLDGVIDYIWVQFDADLVRKAPVSVQVEWERNAKAILRHRLQMVKDVEGYKPATSR